jgi:hypothetical protein
MIENARLYSFIESYYIAREIPQFRQKLKVEAEITYYIESGMAAANNNR